MALATIAGACDGARVRDECGFNKLDAGGGRNLMSYDRWSPEQFERALRMALRYRRQIGSTLTKSLSAILTEVEGADTGAESKTPQIETSTVFDAPEPTGWQGPAELLKWGAPKRVKTKRGLKIVRSAQPDPYFWDLWRTHKSEMREAGISVGKYRDEWQVTWWQDDDSESKTRVSTGARVDADLASRLLPWQPNAVETLARSLAQHGCAVDASDTGVGKTTAALAAANICGLKPLVICSKAGVATWRQWAPHVGVELLDVANYELLRMGSTPYGKWNSTEGSKSKWFQWTIPDGTVVILDEVHKAGGTTSLNGKMVRGLKLQSVPCLALSATLAESPLRMRSIAFLLGLYQTEGGFWKWAQANGVYKNRWNGMEFRGGRHEMRAIHEEIFGAGRGVRLRTTECEGFPDNLVISEPMDFEGSNKIAAAYAELDRELTRLEEVAKNDDGDCILTVILRARQQVELLKVPSIAEIAKDLVEEGNSVVIFLNFQASIEALARKLSTRCLITGQNPQEREHWREEFQADRERILVANSAAGGESLSLHDLHGNHPRVTLMSPSNKARETKQALGRTPRAGGKTPVIQKFLWCAGTIEEETAMTVAKNLNNLEALNDGALATGMPWANYKPPGTSTTTSRASSSAHSAWTRSSSTWS